MQTQTLIQFDAPANGTYTSQQAARRVGKTAAQQRESILEYLRRRPFGEIRESIGSALRIKGDSLRPRCKELIAAGLIEETAVTRPTLSGRSAFVLRVITKDG